MTPRRDAPRPDLVAGLARPVLIALGLAFAVALTGCSMKSLAHPMRVFGEPSRGNAPDPMLEAQQRMASAPDQPYWAYRVAELQLKADSTRQAEASLKVALARDPAYPPALSLFSKLCFESGRHQEAVALLEAARSQSTRFPGGFPAALLAGLALHYDALERPDLARAALAAVPRSGLDETGSAAVYLTLRGDSPDSAAALASSVLRGQPRSAPSRNNFGIIRLRAGDPTEAHRAFMEAIEIDPRLPGPYYNLAILEKFYRLDDAAALKWFRLYRERSTLDPDGLAGALTPSSPEVAEKAEKKEDP